VTPRTDRIPGRRLATGLVLVLLLAGCGGDEPPPRRVAHERQPTPAARLERGIAAERAGRYDEALTLLAPLVDDPELGARARNQLGMIDAAQDSLDAARRRFKAALDLDPDLALAHNNLGALYALDRRDDLAEIAFRQAAMLDPDYPEPRRGQALVALRRGQLRTARRHLDQAEAIERHLDADRLRVRSTASLQSLALWPWTRVDSLIAAEERRRRQAAAQRDSAAAREPAPADAGGAGHEESRP
jgi:Tfp pilus assembly protein PilF